MTDPTKPLCVFLLLISLTGCAKPGSHVERLASSGYFVIVDNVVVKPQQTARTLQTYDRTCAIESVRANESACNNADWSVWSVYIPGQQPIGKKYRVTITELP